MIHDRFSITFESQSTSKLSILIGAVGEKMYCVATGCDAQGRGRTVDCYRVIASRSGKETDIGER